MVAYSFKAQFAGPIWGGIKRQTIRNDRKRHARPGELLQLYTGMRTKSCRLIGRALCAHVTHVRIDFIQGAVEDLDEGRDWSTYDELEQFAIADGFGSWRDLEGFWTREHPNIEVFSGVMIRWGDLL